MKSRIIAVDLAKDVFEVAIATEQGRIVERHRFTRKAFSAFLGAEPPAVVLFEACGTAHFWGRTARAAGHEVRLLPAQYTAPYRRRGKTDRADTEALLEAHRCDEIKPVPIRSVEQQMLQQLHRVREQWKHTRTQRINGLRGFLRELGFPIPQGAKVAQRHARQIIDDPAIPGPLKVIFSRMLDEISTLEPALRVSAASASSMRSRKRKKAGSCNKAWHTQGVSCLGKPETPLRRSFNQDP